MYTPMHSISFKTACALSEDRSQHSMSFKIVCSRSEDLDHSTAFPSRLHVLSVKTDHSTAFPSRLHVLSVKTQTTAQHFLQYCMCSHRRLRSQHSISFKIACDPTKDSDHSTSFPTILHVIPPKTQIKAQHFLQYCMCSH